MSTPEPAGTGKKKEKLTPQHPAVRHLNALDPDADEHVFITLKDSPGEGRVEWIKPLIGTFEHHRPALERRNRLGYGIFVAVNAFKDNRRGNDNVSRFRALFRDIDGPGTKPLPIEPHLIIETSPGKRHEYILTEHSTDAALWNGIERALVSEYGGDPSVKDPARILRLAGFFHMKDPAKPHMVRFLQDSGEQRYALEEVAKKIPPIQVQEAKPVDDGPAEELSKETLADIESALGTLDASDYGKWIEAGLALKRHGEQGFDIWTHWSSSYESYTLEECRKRWAGFEPNHITYKTLIHQAQEAGWQNPRKGKPRLAVVEELSAHRPANQMDQELAKFDREHGVVSVGGKTWIVRREKDALGEMVTVFSDKRNTTWLYEPKKAMVLNKKGEEELKPVFPHWMCWERRRTYRHLCFKPIARMIAGDTKLPDSDELNLFQGMKVVPRKGDCSKILNHIYVVWCKKNEVAFVYVMSLLARMFQHPDERGHVAIVLKSGEGAGKNIIVDMLVDAWGAHGTTISKPRELTGQFTGHLGTSVLVFANEAIWGGDKAQEGVLKSIITDKLITTEEKYQPIKKLANCIHLIIASNNDWAAPIGMDDRRFFVLDVADDRARDSKYFGALSDQIENGGHEAFIQHLLDYDISGFNPREMPEVNSASKRAMKLRTAGSVERWWADCLESGEMYLTKDMTRGQYDERSEKQRLDLCEGWESAPVIVTKDDIYTAYQNHCHKVRESHIEGKEVFFQILRGKKGMCKTIHPSRPRVDKRLGPRIVTLPLLDQCRIEMDHFSGGYGPWHDPVDVGEW